MLYVLFSSFSEPHILLFRREIAIQQKMQTSWKLYLRHRVLEKLCSLVYFLEWTFQQECSFDGSKSRTVDIIKTKAVTFSCTGLTLYHLLSVNVLDYVGFAILDVFPFIRCQLPHWTLWNFRNALWKDVWLYKQVLDHFANCIVSWSSFSSRFGGFYARSHYHIDSCMNLVLKVMNECEHAHLYFFMHTLSKVLLVNSVFFTSCAIQLGYSGVVYREF